MAARDRRRAGDAAARRRCSASAARSLLYLPWVPTLALPGRPHRRAVVARADARRAARRPGPAARRRSPQVVLLLAAGAGRRGAARRGAGGARRAGARRAVLALIARRSRVLLAWLSSQVSPAWATRYLAVALPPFLLLAAGGLAHAGRLGLVGAGARRGDVGAATARRRRRATCARSPQAIAPSLQPRRPRRLHPARAGPGAALLPARRAALRDADRGRVSDVGVTDWRDGVERLRRDDAPSSDLKPLLDALPRRPAARAGRRRSSTTSAAGRRRGRSSSGCARRSGASTCPTTARFEITAIQPPTPVTRAAAEPGARRRSTSRRDRWPARRRRRARSPPAASSTEARAARRRASASASVPPMRSASSRPIARPSPKPPSAPARAAAVEALEDVLALLGGHARARGRRPRRRRVARVARRVDADRLAARARSAARCRAGSARRGRPRPGRRGPSTGRRAGRPRASTSRSRGAQLELGGDGARELAELDRLRAQLAPRRRAARGRAARRPARRAAAARGGRWRPAPGRRRGRAAVAQVLLEQLHRALEHRQRRAQLVRGGGHERAPRRLLAAQLLLHAGERAGEVADLVAARSSRGVGRVRALLGDPQRGGAQAAEPAQQRARERDRERDRRPASPTRAGGQQRVAHLLDRGRRPRSAGAATTSTPMTCRCSPNSGTAIVHVVALDVRDRRRRWRAARAGRRASAARAASVSAVS